MNHNPTKVTITQYDKNDCEIATYTGSFCEVFDSINCFQNYYYRITALGKHEPQERIWTEYFGEKISNIGGHKLSEESFINNWLNWLVQYYYKFLCGKYNVTILFSFKLIYIHDSWYLNRVLSLRQNNRELFNKALNKYLNEHSEFIEISSLKQVAGKSGIYILVLDAYNACYIGQAKDIRRRIMAHWSRNNYHSGNGIDMFKAYDTTRIYAAINESRNEENNNVLENDSIRIIPSKYTLNSMAGGNLDFLLSKRENLMKEKTKEKGYLNINLLTKRRAHRMLSVNRFLLEDNKLISEGWRIKRTKLESYHMGRRPSASEDIFKSLNNLYGF